MVCSLCHVLLVVLIHIRPQASLRTSSLDFGRESGYQITRWHLRVWVFEHWEGVALDRQLYCDAVKMWWTSSVFWIHTFLVCGRFTSFASVLCLFCVKQVASVCSNGTSSLQRSLHNNINVQWSVKQVASVCSLHSLQIHIHASVCSLELGNFILGMLIFGLSAFR